jgi:NADPH:quinone reductase-like Zn-dependent oxidoreductase
VGPPGPDEVIVRVEATPINPSDVGLLLAGADPATATVVSGVTDPTTELRLPPGRLSALAARADQALPVGNEGAGTVVAAGAHAADLLGRPVACVGGGLWTRYRLLPAASCLVLAPRTSARDAASRS